MHKTPDTCYDAVSHLLSRIGLLALSIGMDVESERIFRHQRRILADPSALDVLRAMVMIEREQAHLAVRLLREDVLANEPTHGAANVVLGVALGQAGLPGVRECFETVLATCQDVVPRALAYAALEMLVEQEV